MSAYFSSVGNGQHLDANGHPLSGGEIHTYAAGTSTPIATYTDADGATPQANPIVLNSAGRPSSPIWLPAGRSVKFILKDANGITLATWDDIVGVNDPSSAGTPDQWVAYTGTPTYISATSFSVEGDQTNVLQALRRLKTTNTGGTVYSSVSASSYSPGSGLTTVTVTNDSGALDSGLSAVSYGILSATNPSIPTNYLTNVIAAGVYSVPVDVTFSATPTFDASLGNLFHFGTLTAAVTSTTITNAVSGRPVQIRVQQDATGNRSFAVPAGAKISGAIELGASRVSWLTMTYVGTVNGVAVNRWEGTWSVVPA